MEEIKNQQDKKQKNKKIAKLAIAATIIVIAIAAAVNFMGAAKQSAASLKNTDSGVGALQMLGGDAGAPPDGGIPPEGAPSGGPASPDSGLAPSAPAGN